MGDKGLVVHMPQEPLGPLSSPCLGVRRTQGHSALVVWCGGCAVCHAYLKNIQFDDAISVLVECIESSCVKEAWAKSQSLSATIVCAFL